MIETKNQKEKRNPDRSEEKGRSDIDREKIEEIHIERVYMREKRRKK